MKILQLCKKFPYPLNDGESIAVVNLARSLAAEGVTVSLLCFNTAKDHYEGSLEIDEFACYKQVKAVYLDNHLNPFSALKNLLINRSYHVSRFERDDFKTILAEMLNDTSYDLVLIESIYLGTYIEQIRKLAAAKIIMRCHNVEHLIWERLSNGLGFGLKKWYIQILAKQLKSEERILLSNTDLNVVFSKNDEDQIKDMVKSTPIYVHSIGINVKDYVSVDETVYQNMAFYFLGSLDWMPNTEGLEWFLTEIWSYLKSDFPKIKLSIAGKNGKDKFSAYERVHYHGEVNDAYEFRSTFGYTFVPLLSGSGLRVKILEAMAHGQIVISTTIGAEGIGASHLQNILIADDLEGFKSCLGFIRSNPEKILEISKQAQEFVKNNFDSDVLSKKLLKELTNLVGQ